MKPSHLSNGNCPPSRREFLWRSGGGLGGIALASLLQNHNLLADSASTHGVLYQRGGTQFPAKAKRVIQLYMSGAASQCDTFDYKPLLIKQHGQKWDPGEKVDLFQSSPGSTLASPWPWRR